VQLVAALRASSYPAITLAVLEEGEVVFGNENSLNLSVARQLDAGPRRRSTDEARKIFSSNRGCDLLSHAGKVDSIGAGST
jgi:hypothetical protein